MIDTLINAGLLLVFFTLNYGLHALLMSYTHSQGKRR